MTFIFGQYMESTAVIKPWAFLVDFGECDALYRLIVFWIAMLSMSDIKSDVNELGRFLRMLR